MINSITYILAEVDRGLESLERDGIVYPGCNGPYDEIETPARNTGHWLILFAFAYKETSSRKYYDAMTKCAKALISKDLLPHGVNIWHRDSKVSDSTNGLIGPAWTIESLAVASQVTGNLVYVKHALEIYNAHHFSSSRSVWHRATLTGRKRRIDQTFNHQLWFAAASSKLLWFDELEIQHVRRDIQVFMDNLYVNLTTYPCGLIYHAIPKKLDLKSRVGSYSRNLYANFKGFLLSYQLSEKSLKRDYDLYWKSIGYHSFNLQAFCCLYESEFRKHEFWNSILFDKIKEFSDSPEFYQLLRLEKDFGFDYNVAGFEMIRYAACFKNKWDSNHLQELFQYQRIRSAGDNGAKIDQRTVKARLYELTQVNRDVLLNLFC